MPCARYARKLAYAAHDDGEGGAATYIAMLELVKKRGTPAVAYVLYRRVMYYRGYAGKDESLICVLKPMGTWQEMVDRYWLFPPEGVGSNSFPGYESRRWKPTTTWLDHVSAGGWYESGGFNYADKRPGNWVKIGTPALWKNHRRRKPPLRFGFPAHIVLKLRFEEKQLKKQIAVLKDRQNELECWDEDIGEYLTPRGSVEYEELQRQVDELATDRDTLLLRMRHYIDLMRAEVRKKFPEPLGSTPKRTEEKV